ncbi:hypothetical protein OF83DRAFT_1063381 [Amylostereum chailletii]|nr:hypothetical protein OF83DRAFT_1063381 [Amylostereum chailletii]
MRVTRRSTQDTAQGGSSRHVARAQVRQALAQAQPPPELAPPPKPPRWDQLSELSTRAVPNSGWFAPDFQLASGLVIIQPSSGKVVVVHDTARDSWFLPRGRKDVGESLEQTALREGFEESGFRAEFLPLYFSSNAVVSPGKVDDGLRTEPIFISIVRSGPHLRRNGTFNTGTEYLAFYYVGQIPADAVREENTGMDDEQTYVGTLLDVTDAVARLDDMESHVVALSHHVWQYTVDTQTKEREAEAKRREAEEAHRRSAAAEDGRSAQGSRLSVEGRSNRWSLNPFR